MGSAPIADYGLISDRHSAALVGRDGSVDWLCFPRFDGPSVFARLLDDAGGHWTIRSRDRAETTRRYLDRTMALETTMRTGSGTLAVTDAMLVGTHNVGHDLGVGAPHVLARRVACVGGAVTVHVEYRPRPEYALITPILSEVPGGVTARGGAEWLVLTCPVPLRIGDESAVGEVTLTEGDTLFFGLQRSTLEEQPARVWAQNELRECFEATIAAWRSWSDLHQGYQGQWREQVQRSGLVLQALSYQPSGAIVAAATTALPEEVGGERNWDYRYTWIRDASFTMKALWVAACPDEANDFFTFMATAAPSLHSDRPLQIMYGVGGEHDLSERTLPHLRGWRESAPVRVGNGAWRQRQIDVYGELLDAAHHLSGQLSQLDPDTRRFLARCADSAAVRWQDREHGIWEIRGEPRHFLYSKVMCWVALDRAVAMAELLGAQERVAAWRRAAGQIRRSVLRQGWNERVGAFTQYFGSESLDASNLMIPIVGFLPADDPRVLATIDATARDLTDERGLVYRYRTEEHVDGLAGSEGSFLLCTFWLAQALALSGQVDRARAVFETAAGYANDLGLLSEEVGADGAGLLGNFPQAFSHIGLVNAAWALSRAQHRVGSGHGGYR